MNNVEEEKCRAKLTEGHKKQLEFANFRSNSNNHDNIIPIPKENQEFIDNIMWVLQVVFLLYFIIMLCCLCTENLWRIL